MDVFFTKLGQFWLTVICLELTTSIFLPDSDSVSAQGYDIGDANCMKSGYYYARDNVYQSEEPNCLEGTWRICRDCSLEKRCQLEPCTLTENTQCGPVVLDPSTCDVISGRPTQRGDNCFRDGYYYSRDHPYQRKEPNCEEGFWYICHDCASLHRCQLKPCTLTENTQCGPEVTDLRTCLANEDSSGRETQSSIGTNSAVKTDAKDSQNSDEQPEVDSRGSRHETRDEDHKSSKESETTSNSSNASSVHWDHLLDVLPRIVMVFIVVFSFVVMGVCARGGRWYRLRQRL